MDKEQIIEKEQIILDLVGEFCKKKLDDEYFELSAKLVKKLGRKKNVPFATGKPEIWAAAVIHALGTINFLFDKSFEHFITNDEMNKFFGTSKSTTSSKSKQIRDLLKIDNWDKEFSTKKMIESNPFTNLVMVDGFIVPVDSLPEQYQIMVRQARAEGKDISFNTK